MLIFFFYDYLKTSAWNINASAGELSGGLLQLRIQSSQLLQEPPVRKDPAVLFDLEDGLQQAVMLVDHQEGQDDGGRSAHPNGTVDKNPSCSSKKI